VKLVESKMGPQLALWRTIHFNPASVLQPGESHNGKD